VEGSGRGVIGFIILMFIVEEPGKPTNKCSSGIAGLEVWSRTLAITK